MNLFLVLILGGSLFNMTWLLIELIKEWRPSKLKYQGKADNIILGVLTGTFFMIYGILLAMINTFLLGEII